MNQIAKDLLADINEATDYRRASLEFIKQMGYKKTANRVLIKLDKTGGEGEDSFIVYELEDEDDSKRKVPFSFLYDRAKDDGVILPFPYSKYEALGVKEKPKN